MASSKTTRNHEDIRRWAEERQAIPCEVAATHTDSEPGILRFCFEKAPNRNDANLREISWDEFFEKFDENNLELLFQEETSDGAKSNFNKLIHPESEKGSERHRSEKSGGRQHAA